MPRKKRRSAWASITEVDKGQRYRIRYWAETPEGYRRKSETVRGTRMDAERRRSELMLLHSEDAPCPTVAQAWERWVVPDLERRVDAGTLAEGTYRQYCGAWRNAVAPMFATVPCDQVRPLRIQQWLDTLTRSQAVQAVKVMGKVMDAAVRYEGGIITIISGLNWPYSFYSCLNWPSVAPTLATLSNRQNASVAYTTMRCKYSDNSLRKMKAA